MKLKFKNTEFDLNSLEDLSVNHLQAKGWSPGDGVKRVFTCHVAGQEPVGVTGSDIIEPPGNEDVYYQDKDESLQMLLELEKILEAGHYLAHNSEPAKHWARAKGIAQHTKKSIY